MGFGQSNKQEGTYLRTQYIAEGPANSQHINLARAELKGDY